MVWNFGDVLGCVVLLVFIKFLIVAMVMKSFGFSWEASTLAGACMAQVTRTHPSVWGGGVGQVGLLMPLRGTQARARVLNYV